MDFGGVKIKKIIKNQIKYKMARKALGRYEEAEGSL